MCAAAAAAAAPSGSLGESVLAFDLVEPLFGLPVVHECQPDALGGGSGHGLFVCARLRCPRLFFELEPKIGLEDFGAGLQLGQVAGAPDVVGLEIFDLMREGGGEMFRNMWRLGRKEGPTCGRNPIYLFIYLIHFQNREKQR